MDWHLEAAYVFVYETILSLKLSPKTQLLTRKKPSSL